MLFAISDVWITCICILFVNLIVGLPAIIYALKNIRKIEVATNSMKDALVKASGEEGHAQGEIAGRIAGRKAERDEQTARDDKVQNSPNKG